MANHSFASLVSKLREKIPCGDLLIFPARVPEDTAVELPPITEEYVSQQIDIMTIGKACGVDGIGSRLLKLAKSTILKPLTDVFNVSIQSGIVPILLKKARVIPVYKPGDREYINNYRSISIFASLQ